MRLSQRIQDRGDSYNYAPDFRRLDAATDDIIAGKPSREDLAAAVLQCQPILRL